MPTSRGFRDLKVYGLAFELAMEIFHLSKHFPTEEKYSLTDQIRRASRSVASNIGEGYRKKRYPKMLLARWPMRVAKQLKLRCGLNSQRAAGYVSKNVNPNSESVNEEVGRMLGGMIAHPERFS